MKHLYLAVSCSTLLLTTAACINKTAADAAVKADPASRQTIGLGIDYLADPTPSAELATKLNKSMQERRRKGWAIGQQVFKMVQVPHLDQPLPVWLTWYEMGEISAMFKATWPTLSVADQAALTSSNGLSEAQIHVALAAAQTASANDPQATPAAKMGPLLAQINDAEKAKRGQVGFLERLSARRSGVPFASPAFTRHLLANVNGLANCTFDTPADLDLQGKASFVACMDEFPRDAVMVKSAWEKVEDGIERFDLSADAWTKAFSTSLSVYLPGNHRAATPGADKIFRLKTGDGQEWALRAIHVATKETRHWIWTSFSWSETPDTDLGSDRPLMEAPWNNYKMTIVSDFTELDPTPWIGANGTTIDTLKAIYEMKAKEEPGASMTTWATDPHIETDDPKSNCIGCHNGNFEGNNQTRKNFPTDFSFQVQTLAKRFKHVINQKAGSTLPPEDDGATPPFAPSVGANPPAANSSGT